MTQRCLTICLLALLALQAWPTAAQHYTTGSHTLRAEAGEVRINVGMVGHHNAHSFQVYTFLFRPQGHAHWHQLPIARVRDASSLDFTLARTATADFTIRDAVVAANPVGITLTIAELRYVASPYDDDARVYVEQYRLIRLEDFDRWVFEKMSDRAAPVGQTVEEVLQHAMRRQSATVPQP